MRFRKTILFFSAMLLVTSSCGSAPAAETETKTQIQREIQTTVEESRGIQESSPEETGETAEETSASGAEAFAVKRYVGVRGHIKEIQPDAVLISSDTDEFPGVFWVTGIHELAAEEERKGGVSVFVLMEDVPEEGADGIRRFRGEQLTVLSDEDERARQDVLLTSAPPMTLTDALSSRYESFEVPAGSYSWTTEKDGEGLGVVACGPAPTDEAALKSAAKLRLPEYNRMDEVIYILSFAVAPDTLLIRQWDSSAAGSPEAQEECISMFYYHMPVAALEKGKIYEFTAEWKKTNLEKNGFCGSASYVLVTE